MCGITGYYSLDKFGSIPAVTLSRMADQMINRGPDDSGIWFDKEAGIGFAHRRLSIIDLSKEGQQPMQSASGRHVIVFNGEIYNFKELRTDLEDKEDINWKGNSDTEVLITAIEIWGIEKTLDYLNGMFAFAVWDRRQRTLFLARDPLGKKPLYYGYNNGIFFFASELKALKAHPEFNPDINRDVLPLLLRHSYIPAPYSIYKGIKKLMPGSFLEITEDDFKLCRIPEIKKYWDLYSIANKGFCNSFSNSEDLVLSELEAVLLKSVSRRMFADVPLGSFLSGGIDSSLIVALMQATTSNKVKTFSIGFHDRRYNEAEAAKKIAKHLGTEHTEFYLTAKDSLDVIPKLPQLFDEPFGDSSQIPTYLVSKITRKYVTVALSGDGGDEVFAGYNRHFWGRCLWNRIHRVPVFIKAIAKYGIDRISPMEWDSIFLQTNRVLPQKYHQTMPGDKLAKLSRVLLSRNRKEFYYNLTSWWQHPDLLVKKANEPLTFLNDFEKWPDIDDFTHLMQYMDMLTYLPDDILTKVDRSSMGVGLETRAPFLDKEVVAFSWKIPMKMKISNYSGKIILKKLLTKYIPQDLVDRPKSGFGVPLDQWLRNELLDWANDLLSPDKLKNEGFFSVETVGKAWRTHLSQKNNLQYHLWNILMFQAWLESEKKTK